MNASDISTHRLQNEHLIGTPLASPAEVVRLLCAVQSQDYPAAKWGIAQRLHGVTNADIDRAFNAGTILRTHAMRPTWHFVMPEDIRWLQELTAPRVRTLMAYYDRKLDIDDKLLGRGHKLIIEALQGGKQLTRTELAGVLKAGGISAQGQRLAHIVMHAELNAVVCSGAIRGKQFTYALVDDQAPHAKRLERDEALAKLASRYFTSHGPATVQDFSWWSGLTIADAKKGAELAKPALVHEVIEGATYYFAHSRTTPAFKKPLVHLLPNYDEYLIAYRGYGAIFSAAHLRKNAIDALRAHIIVLDGKVAGGWKRTIQKDHIAIQTDLLVDFGKPERAALADAADAYGRFMGLPVKIA